MRPFTGASLVVLGLVLCLGLACAGGTADAPVPNQGPGLRGPRAVTTDCFDFPKRSFNRKNYADPSVRLTAGNRAVDFTLRDTQGKAVRLNDMLQDKPVLLVQGSWTCPRFQTERAGLEKTYQRFRDDLEIVIVYNIEAHPANDPSPYRGKPWPKDFSDRGQPTSYEERLRNAKDIARDASMRVLVDDFDAPGANPVWCTYGTCPSCSWLIGKDGMIAAQHEWHEQASMEQSITALLAGGS